MTNLSYNTSLSKVSFHYYKGDATSIPNLSLLKNTAITTFDFFNNTGCAGELTSISGIEEIVNLQTIIFPANALTEIPDLSKLTNLSYLDLGNNKISDLTFISANKNLETLILNDNKIQSLHGLESLTNIKTLNLKNNCIYPTYTDSDSNKYYNLQILANLNTNGNLKYLYLNGNGITDYSLISGLTWSDKDF